MMKIASQKINEVLSGVSKIGMIIAGGCLVCTVLLINVEVIGRYIFNYSTLICDEYSGYFFSVMTMVGLVYSLHRGHFLRVTFLTNQFSPRFQNFLYMLAAFLGFVFSAILTYQVARVPYMSYLLDTKSIGSDTSIFLPQLIMPIGMAVLTLEFLNQAVQQLVILNGNKLQQDAETGAMQ